MGAVKSVKKWGRRLLLVTVALFILLNVLAYHHAHSFFYFTDGDVRTPPPEALNWKQKVSVLMRGIHVPKPKAHTFPEFRFEEVFIPGRGQTRLAAWRIPRTDAAATVILFHGYSGEKSGLMPEARLFRDMGCEVVMVDFPGSGQSPGNMTTLGIHEAEDVAAVIEWARREWPDRPLAVYGHSMGGAAIMRAMAVHDAKPDVAIVESVFDSLLNAIRFRFNLLSAPSFPAAELLLFWGSVQLGVNGFDHDVVDYARSVQVPTMIIHGKQDNRASLSAARKVYDALSGRKKYVVMETAGHVNPCVSDQSTWVAEVGAFLRTARSEVRR